MIGAGAFVRFGGELADVYEGFLPARRMRRRALRAQRRETTLVGARRRPARRHRRPDRGPGRLDRGAARPRRPGAPADGTDGRPASSAEAPGSQPPRGEVEAMTPRRTSAARRRHQPRARFSFEIVETFEAGIELQGTRGEVAARGQGAAATRPTRRSTTARSGCAALHIPPYPPASDQNHEPERPRKLLLHRREIERLIGKTAAQGPDPDPDAHLLQGPAAKVELALARGKEGRDRRRDDPRARRRPRDRARDEEPSSLAARPLPAGRPLPPPPRLVE